MHSLSSNFDKFFHIAKKAFKQHINKHDNFFEHRNKPKMSDLEILPSRNR